MNKKKPKLNKLHEELKKKREEAMNDPNSALYMLKNKYYMNNYSSLQGMAKD